MKRNTGFWALAVVLMMVFAGCATTRFTITDEMAKPIIDSEMSALTAVMENDSAVAVWWCDDERFEKQPDEKEHITKISYWIQGYLEQELVMAKNYNVVTRTQLDKIFREQEFQYSGRVDEDTMVSVCKILGAKYMVIPRITPIDTLNMQVLNSETGKILYLSNTPFKSKRRIGS